MDDQPRRKSVMDKGQDAITKYYEFIGSQIGSLLPADTEGPERLPKISEKESSFTNIE
jgi:hypothetical protein